MGHLHTFSLLSSAAWPAFCRGLETIDFPDSLQAIGKSAFANAKSLTSLVLPKSLTELGELAFQGCSRLASLTLNEGLVSLPDNVIWGCGQLACIYLPASLQGGMEEATVNSRTVIYAPEESTALKWAKEYKIPYEACSGPDEMPEFRWVWEGDFLFRLRDGEAALSAYRGSDARIMIPEEAEGLPVTAILEGAVEELCYSAEIVLPKTVRCVEEAAIQTGPAGFTLHLYINSAETALESRAVLVYGSDCIIHAPEGSLAEQYVRKQDTDAIVFDAWLPEEENSADSAPDLEARFFQDALVLAERIQGSIKEFWKACDQGKYAWLKRIPDYQMDQPAAAALIKISEEQVLQLEAALGERKEFASSFTHLVNKQWNLPYDHASAQSAQTEQFETAEEAFSCAFALLVYKTDIVLLARQKDGRTEAALFCSSPETLKQMTPDFILSFLEEFGVAEAECKVYSGTECAALLKK